GRECAGDPPRAPARGRPGARAGAGRHRDRRGGADQTRPAEVPPPRRPTRQAPAIEAPHSFSAAQAAFPGPLTSLPSPRIGRGTGGEGRAPWGLIRLGAGTGPRPERALPMT